LIRELFGFFQPLKLAVVYKSGSFLAHDLSDGACRVDFKSVSEKSPAVESQPQRFRFNPLVPGVLLIFLGLGMFVIVSFIGLTPGLIGLVLAIWGGTVSFFKK
jgi:hypothetical protein